MRIERVVARYVIALLPIALGLQLSACTKQSEGGSSMNNPVLGAGTSGSAGASGVGGLGAATAGAGAAGAGGASGVGGSAGMLTSGGGAGAAGMLAAAGMGGAGAAGAGTGGQSGTAGSAGSAGGGSGGTSGAGAGAGAGGSGTGGAGSGGAGGSGATFAAVYMIISTKCGGGINGCHVSGDSGGLEMPNASTAFMNLVGVDSEQCAGETRVVAGDAANSVLYQAISSASNCIGQRMPYQRAALTMQEIMTIRSWIDAGAMNN